MRKSGIFFKSNYVICFELVKQIMKNSIELHVNSYFNHETVIQLTWIAKSIEAPSEEGNGLPKDQKKF